MLRSVRVREGRWEGIKCGGEGSGREGAERDIMMVKQRGDTGKQFE